MTDAEIEQRAANEAMARGYHDIPDDAKLKRMSFVELAALLSSCESGSARFSVVERELKKHLAKDQAEINRKNIILGACMGGVFGLGGVVLGAWLKNSPPTQQVATPSAIQQVPNGNLTIKPPVAGLPPSTPSVALPANNPAPVQNNAQPTKPHP